jgi:hypothetical protein
MAETRKMQGWNHCYQLYEGWEEKSSMGMMTGKTSAAQKSKLSRLLLNFIESTLKKS